MDSIPSVSAVHQAASGKVANGAPNPVARRGQSTSEFPCAAWAITPHFLEDGDGQGVLQGVHLPSYARRDRAWKERDGSAGLIAMHQACLHQSMDVVVHRAPRKSQAMAEASLVDSRALANQ